MPFSILVIYTGGRDEYLKRGASDTEIAVFRSRREADEWRDFIKQGLDTEDDVQSVNVVTAPKGGG